MSIEEKYNIQYFNNKRYYKFDLTTPVTVLDNTIPYFFEYNGKRIYETAWNRLTVKILEMLDSINPLPNETLLSLEYDWSKVQVFSSEKRTNFSKFKDIYVNTNHTATHSGMSIRFLLKAYGVEPGDCTLYIRRHPVAEPPEAREYFRNQTEKAFRNYLELQGKSESNIDIIIKNFNVINKYLANHGSTGFNDFFLFDDYGYFCNYKIKTLEYVNKKYYGSKNQRVTEKCLELMDGFYKHRDLFMEIDNMKISDEFADLVADEIDFLFNSLKSNIISSAKLYARMTMLHSEEMEVLGKHDNLSDFYSIIEVMLSGDYYFKKPFISNDPDASLSNDDILLNYALTLDTFNSKTIKDYANKMHLKPVNNYVEFMEMCSEYYVQIDADKMVSKESMEIEPDALYKIQKEIAFYIKSFGKITVDSYKDYDSLPSLIYKWNPYLLVGILRTYLNDYFEVKSSGGNYKSTEYTISLKS